MPMVAKVGDVFARYCRNVEFGSRPKKLNKLVHRLLVSPCRLIRATLALALYEMIEPGCNSEHPQTFAVHALQHFAQQFACPRFGERTPPRFVACLLQRPRH